MERDHYFIVAAWREGDVDIRSVQEERFLFARRAWIGQGYRNLQSEWFVRRNSDDPKPDHVRLFAYWEDPDEPPHLDQLYEWGQIGVALPVEP